MGIAKLAGIPVRIAHSHNTKSEHGIAGVIRDFLKWPLKKVATHFFACGEMAAKWLYGDSFLKAGKVIVLPNVIETTRFVYNETLRQEMRDKLCLSPSASLIGCTARFDVQKNHTFLIDVFKEINKLVPESRLLLVGNGPLYQQIVDKIDDLGLRDKVILTGVIPNVADYEQAMDVYVMPSLFEGLPLSVIEAQISGLRCFVSDNVPSETDISGLVDFIPLAKGADQWARQIVNGLNYNRCSPMEKVRKAGYDALTSSHKLQEFYLSAL